MTATAAELTPLERIRQQLDEARRERDVALRTVDRADDQRGGWDKKLIDQAITHYIDRGVPFSSNDVRELLPDVRAALIGARFMAASVGGRIRKVGLTTSTKRNTHSKDVAVWVRATHGGEQA